MKITGHTKNFIQYQIRDCKKNILEYQQLSLEYPQHKNVHDARIKEYREEISMWKKELKIIA